MTKRADAKAATRTKVLAAAKALFEAQGYEQATIRDIAREAGMSTGALFANWRGKAEVYAAVYGHAPIDPETARRMLGVLESLRTLIRRTSRGHTLVIDDIDLKRWDDAISSARPAQPLAEAA